MLVVPCPRCKQRFAIPEESGARWKKCGSCGADFFVPLQMESGGGQVKLSVETKDPPIESANPKAKKKFRVVRPKRLWESPQFWLGIGLGVVALVVSATYTQPRSFPTEVVRRKVQEKLFPNGMAGGRERIYRTTHYDKQEPVGESKFSYTICNSGEWRVRTWEEARSLLPSSVWFDGDKHWVRSEGGRVSPVDTSTVSEKTLLMHLVTGSWCLPSPRIKLTYIPEKSTAEVLAIRVSTAGGGRGTVYVNRLDSLPTKFSIERHQTEFTKYHPTPDGVVVDELETRFFDELVAKSKLEQLGKTSARPSFVKAVSLQPTSVIEEPEQVVSRVSCSYDSAIESELEAKLEYYGRICVRPKLAGRDAGWFIFDTGADASLIDNRSMKVIRSGRPQSDVDSFSLGPLRFQNFIVSSGDLSGVGRSNEHIVGVLGCDVIRQAVFELNLAEGKVAVHDPDTYELPSRGDWRRSRTNSAPIVDVYFPVSTDPFPMLIDTGAFDELYVDANTSLGRFYKDRKGRRRDLIGIGRSTPITVSKIEWMSIADRRIENVDLLLGRNGSSSFGTEKCGLVGVDALTEFTVVFDLANWRIGIIDRDAALVESEGALDE